MKKIRIIKLAVIACLPILIAVIVTGYWRTKTPKLKDIRYNEKKYIGEKVIVKGWVSHNLRESLTFNQRYNKAMQEYQRKKEAYQRGELALNPLPPAWVRPKKYSYISGTKPMAPGVTGMMIKSLAKSIEAGLRGGGRGLTKEAEDTGMIWAEYESPSFPDSGRRVRATGTVEMRTVERLKTLVLVVKSWNYIKED